MTKEERAEMRIGAEAAIGLCSRVEIDPKNVVKLLDLADRFEKSLDAADAEVARLREAIRLARKVRDEAWFVLSGGDNPAERCTECGCGGYGDLRDALKEFETAREALGRSET